jgi:hypothetical protein
MVAFLDIALGVAAHGAFVLACIDQFTPDPDRAHCSQQTLARLEN